jgi:hypothetical protein
MIMATDSPASCPTLDAGVPHKIFMTSTKQVSSLSLLSKEDKLLARKLLSEDFQFIDSKGSDSENLSETKDAAITMLSRYRNSSKANGMRAVRGKKGKKSGGSNLPPELSCVIQSSHRFRFRVVAGFSTPVNITGNSLAGIIGGICTVANTTVATWASSVRVHSITIYPPSTTIASAPNPPEVVWFSPITVMEKDDSKERVFPPGVTTPLAVHSRPPPNTLCADWFGTVAVATQPLFAIGECDTGAIIDVSVSWTMSNNLNNVLATVAAGTLSKVYYLYLDGSTSHNFAPVGKPSTF